MKVPRHARSSPNHIICPGCGTGGLRLQPYSFALAGCDSCGQTFERGVFKTLKQIVALQDVIGKHACEECEHPGMRRLPDGWFLCPACRSEVLPVGVPNLHDELLDDPTNG